VMIGRSGNKTKLSIDFDSGMHWRYSVPYDPAEAGLP
jgi:hypothetical protein